ncbi:MAG: DUF3160 domain-containing protein [Gemmataceae bacterium]|nr:DUF3160 domain-containing protein [Gemmataceae bacterium]
MPNRRLAWPVVGSLLLALVACVRPNPQAGPASEPTPTPTPAPEPAAAPPGGGDPFGYSAAFDAELKKVGQITPAEFASRYPTPKYQGQLSFDPTTAKFFDKLDVEKLRKPGPSIQQRDGKLVPGKEVEIRGYKLTATELAAYKKNGFVVSERLGGESFGQVYYDVYTRDLPVFVTSDSVLHAWHRSYDAMLEELELTYLRHALDGVLAAMHDALPKASEGYGNGVLKDSVRDADYFLTVALKLLHEPAPPDSRERGLAPLPARQLATKLDQDARVAKTLAAVKAEGMHEFELFGRVRIVDFSQFKPRGHYEAKHALRTYFKAMMWCGRTDLRIAGGQDATGPLSSGRELGAAMVLLDLLRRADKEDAWRKFDRCLQTFVGRTDSATFDDLAGVARAAKIKTPADLKTEDDLKALAAAVQESDAGKQDIRGDVYASPFGSQKAVLPRSFTVLGQKFVVDSWATSKTVYDDILWNNEKVQRRVPSGVDVAFAAFGNNHVVPNLVDRMTAGGHTWRDRKPYQHNLAAVRNVIDGVEPGAWDDTIYMQWLKTLRTLPAPADDKTPEAMKTHAWAMKQTNTQMASWTQLRHDTILYVKQSFSGVAMCYYPAGFVEPVVPFWAQMSAMASRSADLIEQTPFPDAVKPTQSRQVKFLRDFSTRMSQLRAIAEKQLAQKDLDAAEKKLLEDVMQIVHVPIGSGSDKEERYTGWYPALFYRGPKDCVAWDALTADVHTDPASTPPGDPGCVLHQGVGNVDLLVIAIDNGKDRVVYVGPTMSHYEFEMPHATRKPDSQWKADLLEGKAPARPDYTRGYLVPVTDRPPPDDKAKRRAESQRKFGVEMDW